MKADYIVGICVSNDDPKNLGRIRAVPLTDLGTSSSLNQLKEYVAQQDTSAEASKTYKPWVMTYAKSVNGDVYREKDKFLCEPYLPKNIGLTPNFGQLVKILKYDENTQASEFIGPYTIDQITLTEQFYSVVSKLQKNENLTTILPKKTKTFLSGYKNEQIMIGDDEFIVRLSHVGDGKVRKNEYPFIQLSQFNNSYKIVETTQNIDVTPDVPIDYICQLYITYTPKITPTDKNFVGSIILFDAKTLKNSQDKIGLTKKTISNKNEYTTKDSDNYLVKHLINSNNSGNFIRVIDEILRSYQNKSEIAYFNTSITANTQTISSDSHTIIITNKIPDTPNTGGATADRNIVNGIKNWIFRLKPDTKITDYIGTFTKPNLPDTNIESIKYYDYLALDNLITSYKEAIMYGTQLKNNTPKIETVTTNIPESINERQSVYVTYADKFIFLSSLKNKSIVDNINDFDGLPSSRIAQYLDRSASNVNKTYGFVRGESLMNLLKTLIDVFKNHGHTAGVNPTGSLTETSKNSLDSILQDINKELDVNATDSVIINHNFRHN
jgi:hypothetical protein